MTYYVIYYIPDISYYSMYYVLYIINIMYQVLYIIYKQDNTYIYICMYICMYIHTHIYIWREINSNISIYIYTCRLHTYMYTNISDDVYITYAGRASAEPAAESSSW